MSSRLNQPLHPQITAKPRRSAWLLSLALVLVLSQLGAITHSISHLQAEADESHVVVDGGCSLCTGYAQLLGAAPAPAIGLPLLTVAAPQWPTLRAERVQAFAGHHFRSRAPPLSPLTV